MPARSVPRPARQLVAKSLILAAASSAPLVTTFVTLLLFKIEFGDIAVLTLGMAGSILGIAVAISAGCMVMSVRRFSKLRAAESNSQALRTSMQSENTAALWVGIISLLIVIILAALVPIGTAVRADYLHTYLFGVAFWFVILPLTQVLYGVMQAFGRERQVLTTSLTVLVLQLGGVLLVTQVVNELNHALLLAGAMQSIVALGVFLYRLALIKRLIGGSLKGVFSFRSPFLQLSFVSDRVLAGGDGLIYMGIFAAATYVASLSSVADGAFIALIVSYMRLAVIPIKQFGLVGGRLLLQGASSGVESFRDVRAAALLPCLVAGLVAAGLSLALLPGDFGWAIAAMVLVQLALEPRSGVTFALGKVVLGPRVLFSHLIVLYLVVLPAIWVILITSDMASALTIWVSIFAIRCLFSLTLVMHLKRLDNPMYG